MAGYIGSAASVVSSGAENKKTFTITGATTSLTGLNYTVGKVHVFQNGVRLVDGTDYTATNGTTITLTVAAQNGDNVVVVSQASFQLSEHYTSAEADAEFVTKTGDTMTGALEIQGGHGDILKVKSSGSGGSEFALRVDGNEISFKADADNDENDTVMTFDTDGSERMRIDTSGNVGIGTSNPSTMLHLSAGTTNSQGGSHAGITMTNKYDNPDNSWSIRPSRDGLSNTGLEIRDVTDDRSVMAFDGAGNVGIGTNSPSYKLDVASHIQIRAGESLRLQNVAGSSAATISCDGAGTNSDLSFKTANTERMSIDTSGRVTMPYQPAFFAHRNGGNYTETNATAKVYIDGTRFNHGGHYDTTNNRFVAPVDGAYQFNASVNCYFISPGYQLRAFLFVNGSSYAVGDSFHSANNSHDLVASVSHVIYLSANDYVEVWSYSDDGSRGFSSSAVWNTFSGHLLG